MNPYIYEIATHGFVAMAAIGGTAIFYSRLINAERARAIEAQRDKETSINSLIACRSTCDILKAKNEELRHDVDRIQAERDTLKAENEQLLMARANYRQAVEDRDSRIQSLETRLNDADARRISAERKRKAEPVNTPETVETQGELELAAQDDGDKKLEERILIFLSKHPGEWKTIPEIAEAVNSDSDTISTPLGLLYWKWKIKKDSRHRPVLYKLETGSPQSWEDLFRRLPDCSRKFAEAMRENPKKWLSVVALSNKTRYAINTIHHIGAAMVENGVAVRKKVGNISFFKLNPNFPTA